MRLKVLTVSRKFSLIFFSLLFLIAPIVANQSNEDRSYDKEQMQAYAESGDFDYMNYVVQPPSIWERVSWWFSDLLNRIFANPNSSWLSKVLFYTILVVVLAAAVLYILRLKYGRPLTSDSRYFRASRISPDSELIDTDYDQMIAEALKADDFKLAIRYSYLKALVFLSGKKLLVLKDWKSPFDYEKELSKNLIPVYSQLSRLFEYTWYGDFEATKEDFEEGSSIAEELKKKANEKG